MDLLRNVDTFTKILDHANDANNKLRFHGHRLTSCVNLFAGAWADLLNTLRDPRLRQLTTFHANLTNLGNDVSSIIRYLHEGLNYCLSVHEKARARHRFFFSHRAEHPLAMFFGGKYRIVVRRAQITHAAKVAKLMQYVALHCVADAYSSRCEQDLREIRDRQLIVVEQEYNARAAVSVQYRHDYRSLWPGTNWTMGYQRADTDLLPLTRVASQWFEIIAVGSMPVSNQVQSLGGRLREELGAELRAEHAHFVDVMKRDFAELSHQYRILKEMHEKFLHQCCEMQKAYSRAESHWQDRLDGEERKRRDIELECKALRSERNSLARQLEELDASNAKYGPSSYNNTGRRRSSSTSRRSQTSENHRESGRTRKSHGSRGGSPGVSDSGVSMS